MTTNLHHEYAILKSDIMHYKRQVDELITNRYVNENIKGYIDEVMESTHDALKDYIDEKYTTGVNTIETEVDSIKKVNTSIVSNFNTISENFGKLETKFEQLDNKVGTYEDRITSLEEIAENVPYLTQPQEGTTLLELEEKETLSTGKLIDILYPVGSIYVSMNSTNPGLFIGGTWKQIENCFLYCVPLDKDTGETGGSNIIELKHLPPHSHTINNQGYWTHSGSGEKETIARNPVSDDDEDVDRFTTNEVGGGEEYMPPYMTVYAWYRTK